MIRSKKRKSMGNRLNTAELERSMYKRCAVSRLLAIKWIKTELIELQEFLGKSLEK